MADLLYHIDEIARRKKTDVVWIAFEYEEPGNWERIPQRLRQHRAEIIFWLEQRKIPYEHCFGIFGGALESPTEAIYVSISPSTRRTNISRR
jgi:hypothetical protein